MNDCSFEFLPFDWLFMCNYVIAAVIVLFSNFSYWGINCHATKRRYFSLFNLLFFRPKHFCLVRWFWSSDTILLQNVRWQMLHCNLHWFTVLFFQNLSLFQFFLQKIFNSDKQQHNASSELTLIKVSFDKFVFVLFGGDGKQFDYHHATQPFIIL